MNDGDAVETSETTREIAALVETLSEAEQRLESLTGGQVDAFITRSGRTFMLQRSQDLLRRHEALQQAAILDALPACVALVDVRGGLVAINEAWRRLARDRAPPGPAGGVGTSYLAACDEVSGDDAALAGTVSAGVRGVLLGELPFYSLEYSRHAPNAQRWFLLTVSPIAEKRPSAAVVTHFDITERMKARLAMQRSTELLAAVVSGTPDHVFVKDRSGQYLLCNDAFARFVGSDPAEMIGRDNAMLGLLDRSVLTRDAALARSEADQLVMTTGEPVSTEDVLTGVDGPRTFLATKAPYRDEHGEVVGVIGISRDISARKQIELQLSESQRLLSMAGRLTHVGYWYVDMPAKQVVWSDDLAAVHDEPSGFSPTLDQAIDYYIPEHREGIKAVFAACANEGVPFDVEFQLDTATGRRIWVRAIGEAVRGGDGAIRRVQGALQDVSDQKRAERETRLLADRLSDILGSITDGFLTLDREWRLTFVNGEAMRILERSHGELIGRNLWEEFPEMAGTQLSRGLRHAMLARGATSFEAYHAPWGAWIGVQCYPSKVGLSAYFSDVTQRRKDQDALRVLNSDLEARVGARTAELTLAREDAEQASRAKSSFLAAMSHEIRTPMNGVVGMIDVLEQSNLKPAQAEIVRTVRESAYALLGIVDDVLDFSKIEAGHFHIDHEPMSLQRVIGRVRDTLGHLAESKGVELTILLDPRLPTQVLGDSLRLRQVLLNLVGNAVKFSSAEGHVGKVAVHAEVLDLGARQCMVEFVVEDDGIGMDATTLAELFQPFTQADVSTTRRFGGTGLGLSISSRIATLMGGRIEVTSALGRGSRFSLRVPFDCVSPATAAGAASAVFVDSEDDAEAGPESATLPMPLHALASFDSGRLVLVAEDNETNQAVIGRQLDLMGFATHIASTGREALELWRRGNYALLLTDLHMPVMDGFELAAAIRAEESADVRLPIVALTADAAKSEIKHCRDVGMDDHMTKPLQLTNLHAMLRKWMPPGLQPRPLRPTKTGPSMAFQTPSVTSARRTAAPAVDLEVLGALVGSNPAVIDRMLASFRHSGARARDTIRLGVGSGRCNVVADAVHPLKSAARSIGALRLAQICDEMEASSIAGQRSELSVQLVRFEQDFADVDRFLDARTARR